MTTDVEEDVGPDPLIGTTVGGRYRIEGHIGRGAMGVVYDAIHLELGRAAAIKVLGSSWAAETEAVQRFLREAQAASSIGHVHIVQVFDLGRLPDGRPYLVMERLRGEPLSSVLERETRLAPQRAVEVIRQAASALDVVHRRGIVHRDIKPENLFLAEQEDGPPIVKLVDFGLAAMATQEARLTRQGFVHGTPHYMAPEACGHGLPTNRGDVYSLAVVAFELLTGEVPIDAQHPLGVLTRKINDDAPSMREVSGIAWPEEAERVMAKALMRDPNERHASAGEFAIALAQALGVDPGVVPVTPTTGVLPEQKLPEPAPIPLEARSARRAPSLDALEAPARASRGGRRGVLAIALVALALLGIAAVAMAPPSGEPRTGDDDASATAGPRPIDPGPESAPPSSAQEPAPPSEPSVAPEPAQEPAIAVAEPTPPEAPATATSRRRRRGGERAAPAGTPDPQLAATAAQTSPSEPGAPTPALAQRNTARATESARQGTTALLQGRIPAAISLFRDATLDDPSYGPAWRGLGVANERLGRTAEAIRAYEQFLRVAPNSGEAPVVRQRLAALRGD